MVDVESSGKVGVRFLRAFTATSINEKTGEAKSRDRVEYCAPGMAHIAKTAEYVSILKKDRVLWPALEPHYNAWKSNNEIPESGTPLAAWAGCTSEEAETLRTYAVRTVEDVAALQDSMIQRIPLPGMRAKRDMAQRFLASADSRKFEQSLAEKDQELADLRAKLDNLADMMAERLDEAEAPKRGPGRPRKEAATAE
jgi:hypothetical protein